MITQKRVKELFDYDDASGNLIFKESRGSVKKGKIAGTNKDGYLVVRVDKVLYRVHRLIWLYTQGYMPNVIDHINHNKKDNRLNNLRDVTVRENTKNISQRLDNTTGITGVSPVKRAGGVVRYVAEIWIEGKKKNLGTYGTKDEAAKSRKKAEIKYGFHENHGGV